MQRKLSEHNRIIAIGDIHGCHRTLLRLLEKTELQTSDQLVFLGDYIDRGPRTKDVIDTLIGLDKHYTCFFLMGNHELMFLEYLDTRDPVSWFYNGGQATLLSYGSNNGLDLPESHIAFMRNCQPYLETEHYFFTHGGLDPELSVKDNLKYYKPEEFCWQRVHMRNSFLESRSYRWEKTLISAHTPVPKPVLLDQLIAIDTGCVYRENPLFGILTAVTLPDRKIIQIDNID
ncbi:MAG: serine/threonine protein phosphatase [Chlorobium sp.]|jgi:serine/threonine protein phosphatase 1|uniref:metallophosphoesterase family protein n=1 Tax=Chlorobium sp. TaxID=1095 RepID=UPI001D25BD44|nr:metallophosphoesterase family protein [Chlorobium sp.]MBN1279580.1 serine/threonine protein phosphatase [Chlorobiaceae bacterium]MCF8216467.1 serine/threonine protein phosphatase [Chlorobium sp.]MCF8271367.1 serine/threonine protein phosphatase [Chlorobium sp.]MCF8287744.1 serine/threonine protein phosphatase [Chlorobium sp.]MCF8291278.1 serine/threonine protein phosphatase [Chlorobium sp.]